jgi:hypothetical protein
MQNSLAGGYLTPAQAQQLGISGDFDMNGSPNNIYEEQLGQSLINPSSYLTEGANPYTQSGAASLGSTVGDLASTSGDWNNYEGLENLLAGDTGSSQASDLSALNADGLSGTQAAAQQAQASAQAASPYTFNNQAFQQAITSAPAETLYAPTSGNYSVGNGYGQWGNILSLIGNGGVDQPKELEG